VTTTTPRMPRRVPPTGPRIVILVITMAFIVGMASLGCTPAAALGIAAGAVAVAWNPRAARAALGA
jgi:hypothetical protein